MNTESKLRLQAYLDNEVSSSEARQIASWIARDPDAKALCEELQATKSLLVADHELPVTVPDSREFYWSKIQREIERTQQEPAQQYTPRPWWVRFLAPVTGAALLAVFVLTSISFNAPGRVAASHQVEKSETDSSITFYSPESKMTVVWIPSDQTTADATVDADADDFE